MERLLRENSGELVWVRLKKFPDKEYLVTCTGGNNYCFVHQETLECYEVPPIELIPEEVVELRDSGIPESKIKFAGVDMEEFKRICASGKYWPFA